MKNLITLAAVSLALTVSLVARAAEAKDEKELKGDGLCLKCELKKSDACQNVVRVKEKDGKETLYIMEKNDVSNAFHKNICGGPKKVVAKGTVKKDGDKNILVASKIELDEKK